MSGEAAAFAALKAQLIDRTGHHYYADKDEQLRERVRQRIAATGAGSIADYLALLEGGSAGEAEWRQLESAVTINETFFFRFADQFAALREHILPDLIRHRAGSRRLRLWSAGCSTGAEAYSLAMVIHDLLGAALKDWQVSILGTDIDEAALAAAAEARFGDWALRATGEAERERLFIAEGRHWTVCPQYRAMVRFERHNLLSLSEAGGALQLAGFDLILCRNVLIYFATERAIALVGELGQRLAPDGWLLIGHAEPGPAPAAGLVAAHAGKVIAWRRQSLTPTSEEPAPAPAPPMPSRRPRPPRLLAPRAALPPAPARDPEATARAALAAGLVDEALAAADEATASAPVSPSAHFLRALALAGLDRPVEARAAFRRALYLDPAFAMAHYLAGVLMADAGERADAARAWRNAADAIAGRPADERVPEGEGMTVADLAAALRWRLAEVSA